MPASEKADVLFHQGVAAAMANKHARVEKIRRRLAPIDPVGAFVLGVILSGNESSIEQVAQQWLLEAQDDDEDGRDAVSSLARLAQLLPNHEAVLAAFGFALVRTGRLAEAHEQAVSLRAIADDRHVAHFNAAGLFEATGDLPAAYAEYEHALLAATSSEDLDDAAVGLRRVAPEAEDTARLLPPDELEARAQQLGRGVIDLAAFGADLPSLVDQYLASPDDGAAAELIRQHPILLARPAVRTVVAAAGSRLFDGHDMAPQGPANLLADAADVGLGRASRYFDSGGRERPLDEPDRLVVAGGDDDEGIAALRFAVNDPGFCDHTGATRSAAEAELGRLLTRRAQQRDDLADLCDAIPLLRRAVSAAPDWPARYWLAVAELGLFRSTGSQVCLERARFLFVDLIGSAEFDDPDITPCLYFRGVVGLARSAIYDEPGDLGVSLLAIDRAINLLESSDSADGNGQLQRARGLRSQIVDELATVEGVSGALPALLERDALVVLDAALAEASFAADSGDVGTLDRIRGALARTTSTVGTAGAVGALVACTDAELVLARHRIAPDPPSITAAITALGAMTDRFGPEAEPYAELTHARLLAERGVDGDRAAGADATARLRQMAVTGETNVARRAALAWGDAAWRRGDADDAAEAYDLALSLRGAALSPWMYRTDQLEELRGFGAAVTRAPLAHVRRGDAWAAAVACEQGRAVLLSNALRGRARGEASSDGVRAAIVSVAEVDPLVYVISADDTGYALIVEGDDATVIRLPGLTTSEVRRAAGSISDRPTPSLLLDVTRWLWDAGFDILADRLGGRAAVNLVATGALGLLPLHAAWRPDTASPDGRRHLVDDLVVRYQPNAQALATATTALRPTVPPATVLTVSNPAPTRLQHLPGAAQEVQAIRHRLAGTALEEDEATRGAVLGQWGRHDVVHFACHGHVTIGEPLRGSLFLAGDHALTAGEILDAEPGGHPLVVLSACETAAGDETIPDEVLTLQSVFVQTGAHGVVGTMWAVDDLATADLMAHFYDALVEGAGDASAALRLAQQAARDASPASGDRRRDIGLDPVAPPLGSTNWMAFTYTGV